MNPSEWTDDRDPPDPNEEYKAPFWCEPCGAAIYSEDMLTHAHRHMDIAPDADQVMRHFEKI